MQDTESKRERDGESERESQEGWRWWWRWWAVEVVGDEGVKAGRVKLEEMPASVADREETGGERHVTGTGLVFFRALFHLRLH